MSTPPVIDQDAIAGLRALSDEDGGAFFREIIGIYLQDTPARIGDLRDALAQKNAALFVRAAHTIKGSSANIGATEVRHVAGLIEDGAREQTIDALAPLVDTLADAFERAKIELGRLAA